MNTTYNTIKLYFDFKKCHRKKKINPQIPSLLQEVGCQVEVLIVSIT